MEIKELIELYKSKLHNATNRVCQLKHGASKTQAYTRALTKRGCYKEIIKQLESMADTSYQKGYDDGANAAATDIMN